MTVALLVSMLLQISASYVLLHSRFGWNRSSSYCQNHCNSDLISLHSISDNDEMIFAINKNDIFNENAGNKNIWIGLYGMDNTTYLWTDQSSYLYTNWAPNQPDISNNKFYTNIDVNSSTKKWQTDDIDRTKRSICNSCDSKLNKYVIIGSGTSGNVVSDVPAAQFWCRLTLKTHMASIHSQRDMDEIVQLCSSINAFDDCWICLLYTSPSPRDRG